MYAPKLLAVQHRTTNFILMNILTIGVVLSCVSLMDQRARSLASESKF